MKKVIVTGANGFVGRYLLRELTKQGYEIWSVIRNTDEDISCINELNTNIVYCDLKDIDKLDEIIEERDFDCFYHLAWAGSSGDGRKNYSLQLNNAKACADAANVASKLGCKRFVGAGSVTELMYGDYLRQDGSKPEMVTCYAIGKIAAEYISKCVCVENGIDFLWAYISNFYGKEDPTQNFINFLIRSYSSGNVPTLTSGEQKADFMYVSDVASALIAMGEKGKTNSTYYIGYGSPKPLKEFVKEVRDIVNPNIETGLGRKSFQGMDIDFDSLDVEKLNRDTGFIPEIYFEKGIKTMIKTGGGYCKYKPVILNNIFAIPRLGVAA